MSALEVQPRRSWRPVPCGKAPGASRRSACLGPTVAVTRRPLERESVKTVLASVRAKPESRSPSICSEADFPDASGSGSRSNGSEKTQERLALFARRHQGKLANNLSMKMATKVMPGAEAASDSDAQVDRAPAAASSYYLRVLAPKHQAAGKRNLADMALMCRLLDLMAKRKTQRAMDFVAQHLKALETASVDGNWARAKFLELMEEEGASMVGRSERYMMRAEVRAEHQLESRPNQYHAQNYQNQHQYQTGKGGKKDQASDPGRTGSPLDGKGLAYIQRAKGKGKGKPGKW
ncbi:unnamed protein product [Prorocentrum cordatum]|uniref:Uncharacterized protein n=1 Tax=Prorocentrum cordatum TaxID=2364126 RepID=A0ABN9TSY5_9DINO|nr:unnamed protein product [Polarella glacialis]